MVLKPQVVFEGPLKKAGFHILIIYIPVSNKREVLTINQDRQNSLTLGILGTLAHFRHLYFVSILNRIVMHLSVIR